MQNAVILIIHYTKTPGTSHYLEKELMMSKEAWNTASVLVHPKGAQWC